MLAAHSALFAGIIKLITSLQQVFAYSATSMWHAYIKCPYAHTCKRYAFVCSYMSLVLSRLFANQVISNAECIVRRTDMSKHILQECPHTLLKCKICGEEMKRKEVMLHMSSKISDHVLLVYAKVESLERELAEYKANATNPINVNVIVND